MNYPIQIVIHLEGDPDCIVETIRRVFEAAKGGEDKAVEADGRDGEPSCSSELLGKDIEKLDLNYRSYNCLRLAGIKTVSELVQKTAAELLRVSNLGRKSLRDIREVLEGWGLQLHEDSRKPALEPDLPRCSETTRAGLGCKLPASLNPNYHGLCGAHFQSMFGHRKDSTRLYCRDCDTKTPYAMEHCLGRALSMRAKEIEAKTVGGEQG